LNLPKKLLAKAEEISQDNEKALKEAEIELRKSEKKLWKMPKFFGLRRLKRLRKMRQNS
jgi:hypothetical protein